MRKLRISVGEILYFLFFCMLFFAKGIGLYDGQNAFKLILVLAVVCLLGKLCMDSYEVPEIVITAFIILLSGISYWKSGDKGLLLYGFMMIGLKKVDLKRLFKVALLVWSIAFTGIWLISLTHMEDTAYRVADKLGMEHIFRWSMGYAHPNVLHISYLILVALIILVVGENMKWKHYIGLILGNLLVFLFSVSYTGVMICFILLFGIGYFQARKKLSIPEKSILGSMFPAFVLLSTVSPVMLKGRAFDILNKILNTRLYLSQHYLKREYISLFGKKIADITSPHWTMDNSYVYALIAYGIVPFLIICAAFLWMIIMLLKKDRMIEVIVVLALFCAGLTEPFLFNTSFKNIGFLFLGDMMFNQTRQKSKRAVCIWKKGNKEITLSVDKFAGKYEEIRESLKQGRTWIVTGILVGAMVTMLGYRMLATHPAGYVVERSHCEDISEEIVLYENSNPQYENYICMIQFMPGDEIEYFNGDIVRMEIIRGYMMCLLIGGFAGSVIALLLVEIKRSIENARV